MPNPSIFISYRIADTEVEARLLYTDLANYFGENAVFLDKKRLQSGMDWPDELEANVRHSQILLVLIKEKGKWLGVDEEGERRIHDPQDWVRLEIEHAAAAGKIIIPLLFNGTKMPSENALPESLRFLLKKQGRSIVTEKWDSDIVALLADLEKTGLRKNDGTTNSGVQPSEARTSSATQAHTDPSNIPEAKPSERNSQKKGINFGWISVFVLLLSGLVYFLLVRQSGGGKVREESTRTLPKDSASQEQKLIKSTPITPASNNGVSAPKPASTPTIALPNVLEITGTPSRYTDIIESKISKILRDQHIVHQVGSGGSDFENRIECVFDLKKSSAQIGMREGFKYTLTLQVRVYGQNGGKCFSGSYTSSTPRIGYAEDTEDEQKRKIIEPGLDEIRVALQQNPPTLCKKRH